MRDQITKDIQSAIAELEGEIAQLDQLREQKRNQLRQYRRALELVDAEGGKSGKLASVTPVAVVHGTRKHGHGESPDTATGT